MEMVFGKAKAARSCAVGIKEKATPRDRSVPASRVKGFAAWMSAMALIEVGEASRSTETLNWLKDLGWPGI